jgi:hypothetical protein
LEHIWQVSGKYPTHLYFSLLNITLRSVIGWLWIRSRHAIRSRIRRFSPISTPTSDG